MGLAGDARDLPLPPSRRSDGRGRQPLPAHRHLHRRGYIKAFDETEKQAIGPDDLATGIYGFTSTDQVAALLLVFTGAMLLLILAFLSPQLRGGKRPAILVEATGEPPELTLRKGQRYHLFNSHIWTLVRMRSRPSSGSSSGWCWVCASS